MSVSRDNDNAKALLAAYEATDYRVLLDSRTITLRIGIYSPEFERFNGEFGSGNCLFITAWNPFSEVLSEADNHARHQELLAFVNARDWHYWPGHGVDPLGEWPGEDSLLVAGVDRAESLKLLEYFEQNAAVFVPETAIPELLCHPQFRITE